MRFSLYTEMQLHDGKTPQQLYREVLEQIENADRLGYDCYASIEHFFFPKFSISAHPTALFAAAAQRTKSIRFRTMLHALPYWNPMVLASAIAVTDILTGGRYEWGVGRGHGWIPEKAGIPLDEHARPKYEEAVDLLFTALGNERFSHSGTYFEVGDSHIVPFPSRSFRIFLGGTSDRTYELAAEHGWGVAVPPLLPYKALEEQLDLYRTKCAEHGTTPDIVWIHACHLDEDARPRYEEAVDLLFTALGNERFSHSGEYFEVGDSHIVPFPQRQFRIFLGGTSDRTYELAAEHGWGVAVPPLLPYKALEEQLDLYRAKCAEHGNEPDIVWIHACHLDEDRDTAMREARDWVSKFIYGNSSPLLEYEKPSAEALGKAGYGFYAAGIMEQLAEVPFEQLVEEDYVWVGTPDDIVARIAETREVCPGITEIGITVNAGGAPHWMAIKNQELFASAVIPRVPAADTVGAAQVA